MNEFTDSLDNIRVASPCPANWNAMIGDEQKRYCSECKLNVYNLSGMTRIEAENFLLNAEGRVCIKFYRRADGSVLTKDCPIGRSAFEQRMLKKAKAFFALCAGIFGGLVSYVQLQPKQSVQMSENNSVKTIEANPPAINIEPKKIEAEKETHLFNKWTTGQLFIRVEPEKKKIRRSKSSKKHR